MAERILDAEQATFAVSLGLQPALTKGRQSFSQFLLLGIEHIITGYDHLLFLFGLLVIGGSLGYACRIVTSFTVAHSLTLALATFEVLQLPSRVVEPLIAVSIVYIGVENLWHRAFLRRWQLTFAFGLLHGLGFASVLRDLGVSGYAALLPLLAFNSGVELGQLALALLVLPLMWKAQQLPQFFPRFTAGCSLLVLLIGTYWLLERTVLP
jgi:hydrogenase/urease accessory protein HupE